MSETDSIVIYKGIPGFPGYRAGSDGTIWTQRIRNGRIVPGWRRMTIQTHKKSGRHQVGLYADKYKMKFVHTLVLTAFKGPRPEGMECCHNDGNKNNNHIDNLRWDTSESNRIDTAKHGSARSAPGEKNHNAVLNDEKVKAIREEHAAGVMGCRRLARKYGICSSGIMRIVRRESWKHVS